MRILARGTPYANLVNEIDHAYSQFGMRRDGHGYREIASNAP